MSKLINAMNRGRGENNDVQHNTSGSYCLDLFNAWGGARRHFESVERLIVQAYGEDPTTLGRILLWGRDVRGGAGERETFRKALFLLSNRDEKLVKALLVKTAEVGRWDDLLVFKDGHYRDFVLDLFAEGLRQGNALTAKWVPRRSRFGLALADRMGYRRGEFQRMVAKMSSTVEQKMSAKDWESIDFSQVPSVAASRYRKAFSRHQPERYAAYLEGLKKGETKINAGAIFPHQIVETFNKGPAAAEAQWAALPDYMEGSSKSILPVVDTSGSMMGLPMTVAISLGIYISERSRGAFRDHFINFSAKPELLRLTGSLADRIQQTRYCRSGYNTNFDAVYQLILGAAVRMKVPEEDMPGMILVLSDMQFDEAAGNTRPPFGGMSGYYSGGYDQTAHERLTEAYRRCGYRIPKLVYWNLRTAGGGAVEQHTSGAAMVSGFSPAILRSILSDRLEDFSPIAVMSMALSDPRYDF
jgi:hypothetical protein